MDPSHRRTDSGLDLSFGLKKDKLYQHLDQDLKQIRILQFENDVTANPAILRQSTLPTLSFSFATIALATDRTPLYDVISHTSTSNERSTDRLSSKIIVNGQAIEVSSSTESALRACCVRHDHRFVFIPTVCINSDDTPELNSQTAVLGDIVSKANRVLAWYGDDRLDCEPAIGAVERLIATLCPPRSPRLRSRKSLQTLNRKSSRTMSLDPQKFTIFEEWSTIFSFFQNPWFSRTWSMQEVCLARRVVCYQGHWNRPMDFWDIARLANHLYQQRVFLPEQPPSLALRGLCGASTMYKMRRTGAQSLTSLLRIIQPFAYNDPHDMVYSILGLRHSGAQSVDSGASGDSRIVAVYQEPILETYAKATKAAIAESGSLSILKHAHSLRPVQTRRGFVRDDFPSWALRLDIHGQYHVNPISHRHLCFRADGDVPLELWPNESSRVLRLRGVVVDIISDVSPCMRWKQVDSEHATARTVFQQVHGWTRERFPLTGPNALAEKFAMTISAGQDVSGTNLATSPDLMHRLYNGFSPLIPKTPPQEPDTPLTEITDTELPSIPPPRVSVLPPSPPPSGEESADTSFALSALMRSGRNRTVFVTQRSTLMGSGTDNARTGDVLCILFGGSVPFILRPEKHYWRFVGDAYVEDIMTGEWIQGLQEKGRLRLAKRWFKIR